MKKLLPILLVISGCASTPPQKPIRQISLPPVPSVAAMLLAATLPPGIVTNHMAISVDPYTSEVAGFNYYVSTNQTDWTKLNPDPAGELFSFDLVYPRRQRPAEYFFVATAEDFNFQESEFSNMVHWPAYPPIVTGLLLAWVGAQNVVIQQSHDLSAWTDRTNAAVPPALMPIDSSATFFRLRGVTNELTITPILFYPK